MAFRLVSGTVTGENYTAGGNITAGSLCYEASNQALVCDGSTETQATVIGVAPAAITSGAVGEIILANDNQIWEVDANANTATAQVLEDHLCLAGGLKINNLDAESGTTAATLRMLAIRGAAANKKCRVRIISRGSVA